jgi:small subunit ribosomal protein S20
MMLLNFKEVYGKGIHMAKDEATAKTKRPTALKRHLQSLRRRSQNRAFRAQVKSAIREAELQQPNPAELEQAIKRVYSLVDRGVKRGVFKVNRAARLKSRLLRRTQLKTSS